MRYLPTLGAVALALIAAPWLGSAPSQKDDKPAKDGEARNEQIQREQLSLAGWDPDEPVPATTYYKKGEKSLPVVIFMHGLNGNKEQYPERMKALADKGMFVVAIDAHLHGERKIPGIFPKDRNLGRLGTDYSIWVHQSAVSHTARDVSKILDALSARPEVDLSRVGVAGISMGSSTCMVLAWKEPRVTVVAGLIGAVDFWCDVTKTPPGKEQDAKRKGLSPRVRQLVDSLDPKHRKKAIAPKALFLANGDRDDGIDVETVRAFVRDLEPSYKDHPERLKLLEEPKTGHTVTDRMWTEGTKWLALHLLEKASGRDDRGGRPFAKWHEYSPAHPLYQGVGGSPGRNRPCTSLPPGYRPSAVVGCA